MEIDHALRADYRRDNREDKEDRNNRKRKLCKMEKNFEKNIGRTPMRS